MFEADSSDMFAGKFLLVSLGGRAEGLACADPGAGTPIGASGNFLSVVHIFLRNKCWKYILSIIPSPIQDSICVKPLSRNISEPCL